MKILFIDNFDSFTYNLVDEFKKLDCEVLVYRNDISMEELDKVLFTYKPNLIVISPGPSAPKDAGICVPLIRKYDGKYPILGICLGHQCIIEALGGKVEKAPVPVHGKRSEITYDNSKIFNDISNPFFAGRYHSLYGSKIPSSLSITADSNGIPMAVEKEKTYGLQFHPESILTADGSRIIKNVLEAVS